MEGGVPGPGAPLPRPPSDAPVRILAAAAEILATSGPSAISFDRLAQDTGLSKGGVLHYFRSRPTLLEALVAQIPARLDQGIAERMSRDPSPLGAYRRAFVAELLADAEQGGGRALLAAFAEDPELLRPFWAWLAAARARIAAELGETEAWVIAGAVEARWLAAALGAPRLDREQRRSLGQRLGTGPAR